MLLFIMYINGSIWCIHLNCMLDSLTWVDLLDFMLIIIQQKDDLQWLIFYYFVQFMTRIIATLQFEYLLLINRQTKILKNKIKQSIFCFSFSYWWSLKPKNKNWNLNVLQSYVLKSCNHFKSKDFFDSWYDFCQ